MADRIEASARLLSLHARLVGGDTAALEQIWGEMWHPLGGRLARLFPRAQGDFVAEAATDAIRAYAARPHAFDPARQVPLDVFVCGIAANMLRTRLRTEKRRVALESDYEARRRLAFECQSDDRVMSRILVQELRTALPLVCNPTELAATIAWLDQDDTAAVAAHLGLSDLPSAEQRLGKKRLIARVIKRLQRLLFCGGGGDRCPSRAR